MVSRLTAVNAIVIVGAFVSGPIIARALGAEGRGELAAIVVVLTIAPWLLDFGLAQWVARERALGMSRGDALGTALPVAFACSLIGVAAAVPMSHVLGADRDVVVTFLQVGLFLTPVGVLLFTLSGLVIGESRWNLVAATRIVTTVIPVVAIVLLSILDLLTVGSAAAATLVAALLGSLLPLRLMRGVRRLRFDLRRARSAVRFGVKSSLTTIAGAANVRFDQVFMAGLVSSRELGLYAVAVSVSSLSSGLILAVSNALYPRVARGDGELAARSCRVTIAIVTATGVPLAALAWPGIPLLFGDEFRDSVTMVLILLLASIPLSAATVLASALNAAGHPAATLRAEFVALLVTLPSLVLFLSDYGGVGAAVISLVAYTIKFVLQLMSARATFERPAASFVLATGKDVRWLADRARRIARPRASAPP